MGPNKLVPPVYLGVLIYWANQIGSLQKKKKRKKVGLGSHLLLFNMKQNKYPQIGGVSGDAPYCSGPY